MFRPLLALLAAVVLSLAAAPVAAQNQARAPSQEGPAGTWFAQERLNAGLPPPPEDLDRSTPEGVLEDLLFDLPAGHPDSAHLLNLREIPREEQAERGPELARQLRAVMDRAVVLDWRALLDRPDQRDARATASGPVAGEPQRSVLLDVLELGRRPVGLRLERIRVGDEAPVWVVAASTVEHIPALHAEYGPSQIEQRIPAPLRQEAFWRLYWWELIALPALAVGALLAGLALDRAAKWGIRRLPGRYTAAVLRALRLPLVFLVITGLIGWISSSVLVFSGLINEALTLATVIGLTLAAVLLVLHGIDAVIDRLISPDTLDNLSATNNHERREIATRMAALRRGLIAAIVLAGVGVILSETRFAATLGVSLIAGAGLVTVLVAFAARKVLGNIMSSMQIAVNRSARIGDKLMFRGYLCNVERIHFTYVQLRVWTGIRLIVPVEEFVSETFENWTAQETGMTRLIDIVVRHDAPVERLRAAFFDVVDDGMEAGELGPRENHMVIVTDQDVHGKTVTFCLACADANTAWALSCEMRERLIAKATEIEQKEDRPLFPDPPAAEAA